MDELLIRQYLQNEKTTRQFGAFYELWTKYESDYRVQDILAGNDVEELVNRAKEAPFDERVSLIGLLLDAVKSDMKEVVTERALLSAVKKVFQEAKNEPDGVYNKAHATVAEFFADKISTLEEKVGDEKRELLSEKEQMETYALINYLKNALNQIEDIRVGNDVWELLRVNYSSKVAILKQKAGNVSIKLENLFAFCEQSFGNGPEMLIVVTELTSSDVAARFIGQYGSEKYFQYNKELLFYERHKNVIAEIEEVL